MDADELPLHEHALDEAAAEARIGSTIGGGWRLDALLGVGGMAAVFAASHPSGNRLAFKILHARHAHDEDLVARFFREVDVVAQIKHPACVKILGSGRTDDGTPLLAMELVEGRSLHATWRARRSAFPVGEALRIADTLLDFLIACHAARVVHRDLTPSNVVLTSKGVRVLDFGLARSGTRRTTGRRALGTPTYMPPEQARGENLDGRADLFSIGAILFTLLTGRSLRRGRTDDELFGAAQREAPVPLALLAPDAPADLVRLVDRALAWHPRDRWPNARAMRNELIRVLESLGPALDRPISAAARISEHPSDRGESRTCPGTPSSMRRLAAAPTSR